MRVSRTPRALRRARCAYSPGVRRGRRDNGLLLACAALAWCAVGCQSAPRASRAAAALDNAAWSGVYAAVDDRDGSTSLLSIRWITLPEESRARPIYHLLARLGRAGQIDVLGAAHIEGDRLTFAIATARLDDEGDSHAIATVERYVYRRSGKQTALIRVEDLEDGQESTNGVLIKIADDPAALDAPAADVVTIGRTR